MRKRDDMVSGAIILTGGKLLLRALGMLAHAWMTRKMGAAGIGLMHQVAAVGSLAMTVGMGGVRTTTVYLMAAELGKGEKGIPGGIRTGCIRYAFRTSSAAMVLLWLLAPLLAQRWIGNAGTAWVLRMFAAFLPIFAVNAVFSGCFLAEKRLGTLALLEIAEEAVSFAVTAFLMRAASTVEAKCLCVASGMGAGSVVSTAGLVLCRCRYEETQHLVQGRIMRTALPLAAGDFLRSVLGSIEHLTVPKRLALCLGKEQALAAFGTVTGMVFPVMMFPACLLFGLSELLMPELSRCAVCRDRGRMEELTGKALAAAAMLGAAWMGVLLLWAPIILQQLYGTSQAGTQLRWYVFLLPMLYCDSITDAAIKGLGDHTACVRINLITNLLDVLTLYWILPVCGMQGYFCSFLITHMLNFLLSFGRLKRLAQEQGAASRQNRQALSV